MTEIAAPFGPIYPDLPGVKRFRQMAVAAGSVAEMDQPFRGAYGEAVGKAIRAKQRAELQREVKSHNVKCASGTNHNDGAKISSAVRAQQRANLLACAAAERRARTPEQWREMYAAAMAEKRARRTMARAA